MITKCSGIANAIRAGVHDASFEKLYGQHGSSGQKDRYLRLLDKLIDENPDAEGMLVSAPGRTELGGNHTDHNNGCVLAAAVDLDCVAAVSRTDQPEILITSEGYRDEIRIDLQQLEPQQHEQGTAASLVRGMVAAFYEETGKIGGFRGFLHATCKPGTGLSSSAAFSVLVGGVLNFLYGSGKLSAERLAHMAQFAENRYFGKPSGLMDQMSSAVGGTVAIDFMVPESPQIRHLTGPADTGYQLMVIDTGGSHVELTPEYAAIPQEMYAAAKVLGREVARGISMDELLAALPDIRKTAGDRAALRLMHFIEENDRAVDQAQALEDGRFIDYLDLVRKSGNSSALMLQNCESHTSTHEQGILLALALTRRFFPMAVCRVHGGGFAGTAQAYVPDNEVTDFISKMEHIFGEHAVIPLRTGRPGVIGMDGQGMVVVKCECG